MRSGFYLSGRFMRFFLPAFLAVLTVTSCNDEMSVDRYSLVTRHNVRITSPDSLNSLSVGNGDFAFTVDITGLQTFPAFYERGIALGTMSNWGWHTGANPDGYSLEDVRKNYDVHGRKVGYVHQFRRNDDSMRFLASEWLRQNPHRIHLGLIGLHIFNSEGKVIGPAEIDQPVQVLDLWSGTISSTFMVDGVPVSVKTICHPGHDLISAHISSDLIADKRLMVRIDFPLGIPDPSGYDLNSPDGHSTEILSTSADESLIGRIQDDDEYFVRVLHPDSRLETSGRHQFLLVPAGNSTLEFSCHFSRERADGPIPDFETTAEASRSGWKEFWMSGGAVDFSDCTDPRAPELERRVVLSQYLTRIQCSGFLPPAETGLTYNSWYGKFHLEMHWWHAVHFALWQREDILEKQMEYYFRISDRARKTARDQGYEGVRWPKMVGPDGRESPSTVGTYLIWQQPHFIFFSELLYRNSENPSEILEKYKDLVSETAGFMASYAWYEESGDRYILGPVLIPAQESLKLETTINPTFELAYWYWGLKTAQAWRVRSGLEPDPKWAEVIDKLSELPVLDGLYLCSEDTRDSYENPRYLSDHPIVSAVSGVLPLTEKADKRILEATLDAIKTKWNWQSTWGWDFPMLAMSAASIGQSEQAVDFLLMDAPKNRYLVNGHNYQDARLALYLPGNGGLLTAVARMCVEKQFPDNGQWNVRYENLNRYPE